MANSYGQSNQLLACHFMPLLSESQSRAMGNRADEKKQLSDMMMAAAARDGITLFEVRMSGDCYFHSVVVALHLHGVRFAVRIMQAENADEMATGASTKKSRPSASYSDKDSRTTCVGCGVSVPVEQFFKHAIRHRKRIVRKSTVCRVCNVSAGPEDFGAHVRTHSSCIVGG